MRNETTATLVTFLAAILSFGIACGNSGPADTDTPASDAGARVPPSSPPSADASTAIALAPGPTQSTLRCAGGRLTCAVLSDETSCKTSGCTWTYCQGAKTDCVQATNGGTDAGLCTELAAYCDVVRSANGIFSCRSKITVASFSCSVLNGLSEGERGCGNAGCTWHASGVCEGQELHCEELDDQTCERAPGCRLVSDTEAACDREGLLCEMRWKESCELTPGCHLSGDGDTRCMPYCSCPEGMELCGNRCVDLNWSHSACGSCDTPCSLDSDCIRGECKPIDVCAQSATKCPKNSTCSSKGLLVQCTCLPGFEGDDCHDIDECASGDVCNSASTSRTCVNTSGGFECR